MMSPPYLTKERCACVAALVFVLGLVAVFLYDYVRTFGKQDEEDETVPRHLQRQLEIAGRNAIKHSLKPEHERLPARMRIRLMKAKRILEDEGIELAEMVELKEAIGLKEATESKEAIGLKEVGERDGKRVKFVVEEVGNTKLE